MHLKTIYKDIDKTTAQDTINEYDRIATNTYRRMKLLHSVVSLKNHEAVMKQHDFQVVKT